MTVLFVCVVWVLWSVTASTETLAFLTETISSWTVSRIPVDEKFWSEILVAAFLSLEALLIKESVLLPVSNLGLLEIFGLGIKRLPNIFDPRSDINRTLAIVAWAPLVPPTNIISCSTHPQYVPWGSFANEKVSIFNVVEVVE